MSNPPLPRAYGLCYNILAFNYTFPWPEDSEGRTHGKEEKAGLHIGSYVIRPLGLTVIGILLVALIVVGTLIIARSISGGALDQNVPEATRQVITPEPDADPRTR